MGEDGRKLLAVAEAMHRRLTRFLEETSTGDPVAAFDALAKVVSAYGTRAYMTAQEIRDKARWPDLSEHERIVARSRERIDRWAADDPDGPDTEQDAPDADPGNDTPDPSCASRGETAAIGEHQEQPLPQQPAGPEAAQKAAFTDPQIRFDFPPFLGDLELTFGPGWARLLGHRTRSRRRPRAVVRRQADRLDRPAPGRPVGPGRLHRRPPPQRRHRHRHHRRLRPAPVLPQPRTRPGRPPARLHRPYRRGPAAPLTGPLLLP